MNDIIHRVFIIAIDGPAASGKGSIARRLAHHYNFAYLDTGSLYRAVGQAVVALGQNPFDEAAAIAAVRNLDTVKIDEAAIRTCKAGKAASVVAVMQSVRTLILQFQRDFALRPPQGQLGSVLDGRDIGTVICPHADVKLFITANLETRARRRWLELRSSGSIVSEEKVFIDTKERDRRDTERAVSPLRRATDAHLLDTTDLSIEVALGNAIRIIDESRSMS